MDENGGSHCALVVGELKEDDEGLHFRTAHSIDFDFSAGGLKGLTQPAEMRIEAFTGLERDDTAIRLLGRVSHISVANLRRKGIQILYLLHSSSIDNG